MPFMTIYAILALSKLYGICAEDLLKNIQTRDKDQNLQ